MHHADDLDVRIIKELGNPDSLQWNVRETYSSIAGRLGVDEETVRRRLKGAERLGSLPGWRMMVNPRLIGCGAVNIQLEVKGEKRKADIISELRKIDGIVKILDFRGEKLLLTLYYQDEASLKTKKDKICSISDCTEPIAWELDFPEPQIRMKTTDWKIIGSMLDNARRSLKDVSESVGVSVRTVERRLNEMSESRAVYLQGTPNFSKFAGLSCVFIVYCPDQAKKLAVDHAILSKVKRIELANTSSKQYSTFVTLFDNLAESDDFIGWIGGLDGVKSVSMGIMKELIVVQKWLQEEVTKRQLKR
ncbi:MAG: AsnC family transcriptional regulator [Thermoplasmataceae archaeon]